MKILYLCTHNRCRSILCEALTNHIGKGHFIARSAGSLPAQEVHPTALLHLISQGVDTKPLQSQSWNEFANFDADIVVTVYDSVANETCPVWLLDATRESTKKPIRIHWPLADPTKIRGSDKELNSAFLTVIAEIKQRVSFLLNANIHHLSRDEQIAVLNKQALLVE